MEIYVDKDDVKRNILEINKKYPVVFENLKSANSIFDDMKTYWYGERYQKIIKIWNEIIPNLNKYLITLSNISLNMSGMLKNYTIADTDVITVTYVAPKKLTIINPKTDKNIDIDTNKLTDSKNTVLHNIKLAKEAIDKIADTVKRTNWKSPAVESFKKNVQELHTTLINNIDTIEKAVNDNLTTTVNEFSSADRSNSGK